MESHQDIDRRSLALAQAIVGIIDADPDRLGLLTARANCARWISSLGNEPALLEWQRILTKDWAEIRQLLLATTENATRLRQSNPFCGVLDHQTRWQIYRRFHHDTRAA